MGNARGLLRLFKYIDEINKILTHMADVQMSKRDKILSIALRALLALFELFDNIGILSKLKVLKLNG